MVRLKDIAAQAGVSVMTVSRVLRGVRGVSPNTKAKIDQIARRLGYVPDALARSLRTRSSQLVGIVLPSMADPLVARSVEAISGRLQDLGFDILIAQTFHNDESEDGCLRRFLSRRVDGLLIWPARRLAPTATIYDEVRNRRVPVVILGPAPAFARHLSSVAIDERGAGYAATQHLLNLDHSRIAFFSERADSVGAQQRLEGYRLALREARLDLDDRLVFNAGDSVASGERAALQMIEEQTQPTALVAANDLVAVGVAEQLAKHGIEVPATLSLVGYGNLEVGHHFKVPLTTVGYDGDRLAQSAVETLIQASSPAGPKEVRLAVEVLPRASTCLQLAHAPD